MNQRDVRKILKETAYIRVGGTEAEMRCEHTLKAHCDRLAVPATLEPFEFSTYRDMGTSLWVNGKGIPARAILGFFGEANGEVFYLASSDERALKKCRGKIVLTEKPMGYRLYDQLLAHGAVGFICSYGSVAYSVGLLDRRERRFSLKDGVLLPGVLIRTEDALSLIKSGGTVSLKSVQEPLLEVSHNVTALLKGQSDAEIVISAHYDSTALSVGAYDNMSGCIALLYLAEYFKTHPHFYSIRLLWCGSEERGLLGSLAYCEKHKDENIILNVNLDMLGSAMGGFVSFSSANVAMLDRLERFGKRHRFITEVRHAIRSSDSNSFVLHKIPSVSFARYAPAEAGGIHTAFDTEAVLSPAQLLSDARYVAAFVEDVANDPSLPSNLGISEKILTDVQNYFTRKMI